MISLISFVLASGFSLAIIWILRASDPKLARAAKVSRLDLSSPIRTALAVSVFLPGAVLLAIPQVGVFFSWFGTITVVGWLIALKRPKAQPDRTKAGWTKKSV